MYHDPSDIEPDDILAAIDQRSGELIGEFYDHFSEYRELHPEATQREVFEGWAIQKIAGLQVMVMDLYERVNLITARTPKRRGR